MGQRAMNQKTTIPHPHSKHGLRPSTDHRKCRGIALPGRVRKDRWPPWESGSIGTGGTEAEIIESTRLSCHFVTDGKKMLVGWDDSCGEKWRRERDPRRTFSIHNLLIFNNMKIGLLSSKPIPAYLSLHASGLERKQSCLPQNPVVRGGRSRREIALFGHPLPCIKDGALERCGLSTDL